MSVLNSEHMIEISEIYIGQTVPVTIPNSNEMI
jgi:hypothetical protein